MHTMFQLVKLEYPILRGGFHREDRFKKDDRIHWFCPDCNDEGFINDWQGLIWDMREGMMH
jgi:hypothetical protein